MTQDQLKSAAEKAGLSKHFINGAAREDMNVIGSDFIERLHQQMIKMNLIPPQ
ncbi:hypothetical protein [Janthinobacterium sp.]|uniref:hypothetical protein n=1 Tax=Janthinobacterium sp. TaxID=1871054 RepID=UPI002615FA40|nr:hypothetical protein [Janthinobacterium sp.]